MNIGQTPISVEAMCLQGSLRNTRPRKRLGYAQTCLALLSLLPRLHPCPRKGRITLNGVSQNVILLAIKSEGIRYLYKDTLGDRGTGSSSPLICRSAERMAVERDSASVKQDPVAVEDKKIAKKCHVKRQQRENPRNSEKAGANASAFFMPCRGNIN